MVVSEVKPFVSPSSVWKGLFMGSGSDGMSDPRIVDAVLSLAQQKKEKTEDTNLLYLGTATYDRPEPRQRQTQGFIDAGCTVQSLDVVSHAPTKTEMERAVSMADIILVSGGNTLFAVDRWKRLGLNDILYQKGMLRGAVLTGGSAGAICWFQGGHSDSMDPASFKSSFMKANDSGGDESSSAPMSEEEKKEWQYIRVDGLGFLPGLICPHHDVIQSNGILRSNDFDDMLLRHPSEFGIGIDHWAALQIISDKFRVISLDGKEGSVLADGTFSPDRKGKPGIWLKQTIDDKVQKRLCPSSGNVKDIIPYVPSQQQILKDPRVDICRLQNPDDGPTNEISTLTTNNL